jgi:hypothetical protein
MSTSAQEFSDATAAVERRFYPRVNPHAPIYLAMDQSEDTLLLNISENGLLVSAPVPPPLNFVARVAIPLTGLPKPVQVNVRVIWTSEINKQAGIQLLDLSEHDREQIRKWGSRESSTFLHRQSEPAVAAPVPPEMPASAPFVAPVPPTQPSIAQSAPTKKPRFAATAVSRPKVSEVVTSPAARVALWGMGIAALCLVVLFLVKNDALGNAFAHSREVLRGGSAPATAQNTSANLKNPDASDLSTNAAANAGTPPPLDSTEDVKHVSAGKTSPHDSSSAAGRANPAKDAASDEETSASSSVDGEEGQVETPPAGKPQSSTAVVASPRLDAGTTAIARPVLPSPPVTNQPARSPAISNDAATRTPSPLLTKPDSLPAAPSPANSLSPAIQMDTPPRQIMDIHLQRGSQGSFFDLPGEHVLESPLATIRIQRSVRMPVGHSVLPLNPLHPFGRSKKVEIGGLTSRVDPQFAQAQIGAGDFVRVVASINENGQVQSVKPVRGRANLLPIVLKAVQEWRYQPTLVDGKPVETKSDVLIEFHAAPRYTARQ